MKTYKNLYIQLLNKDYIRKVVLETSRSKHCADQVNKKLDEIVDSIYENLVNKDYKLLPTKQVVRHDRKKDRNITIAPYYPNKIYDYLLTSLIKPIFSKSMFYWSCGNVKGKGKDMAVDYVSKKYKNCKYMVQLDVKKFYENINKEKLFKVISRKIADNDLLEFYKVIVGDIGKSISLGMNSSIWLGNYFLQGLDYYAKQELNVGFYCRYVDNILLGSNNKMKLKFYIKQLNDYLNNLDLTIKPDWYITET